MDGQPPTLPQQEQRGPGDNPQASRAAVGVQLSGLLLARVEMASSWQGGEDVHHLQPGLQKQERDSSFCSELWCVAYPCFTAGQKKEVPQAHRAQKSKSQRGKSPSWHSG